MRGRVRLETGPALVVVALTALAIAVTAFVVLRMGGEAEAVPALPQPLTSGSASPLVRKIAYGFAVPTIIVAGVIAALVAAKQFYGYVWAKQPKVMLEKTARAVWS